MKKKFVQRCLFWLSATVVVLLVILFTHVYMVTHKPKTDADSRQLSRIDFKQPIDSIEANKIRNFVAGISGVDNAYFNVSQGTLVYTYNSNKQSSGHVYHALQQFGHYKTQKYIVNTETSSMGCPAMGDKTSIKARVTAFIAKL
jgi:hypothetical protein